MNIVPILDKLKNGFVFGSGGIGDALLLLSHLFFKVNTKSFNKVNNIVFWADKQESVLELFDIFKQETKYGKLGKTLVFQGWQGNNPKEEFDKIVSHPNFKGKCHIPDSMNYIGEWTNNYQKYHNEFNKAFPEMREWIGNMCITTELRNRIGIGVFGSRKESFKVKHLNTKQFNNLVLSSLGDSNINEVYVFGSEQDKKDFPIIIQDDRIRDCRGALMLNSMQTISIMNSFISTDTWYKTYTHFLGIQTEVYKSKYDDSFENIFGSGITKDPGNNIFLDNGWNFQFKDIQ